MLSPVVRTLDLDKGTDSGSASRSIQQDEQDIIREDPEIIRVTQEALMKEKQTIEEEQPKKLWVDVISGNRVASNGMAIGFVAPKLVDGETVVEIGEEDVESEIKYWETAVIMYAIGRELSMNAVKQFMSKFWNFVKLPDMFYHEEGYFILKFHSFIERDMVLTRGPFTIQNMPMILKEWSPDFNFKRDMLRTLPIWIKLPQLPLKMWGASSLGKIGSAIGNPLFTDECTANKLRVSYARILVEVDITQQLKETIAIEDGDGKKIQQKVEYEWKPKYCETCQKIGHTCVNERQTVFKKWQPKVVEITEVKQKPSEGVAIPAGKKDQVEVVQNRTEEVTPKQNEDGVGTSWTHISASRKGRNKLVVNSSSVMCGNGFQTIGDWNGPNGNEGVT